MNDVEKKLNTKPVILDAGFAEDDGREIDLMELFFRLLEKAGWIVGAAVLATIVVALYTAFCVTPMYRSTSKLYVLNSSDSAINLNDLNIGEKLAGDYVQVFNNYEVYELAKSYMDADQYEYWGGTNPEVKKLLREKKYTLDADFGTVLSMMDINVINNTRIIEIQVTSEDPEKAMVIANVYALAAQNFIERVMNTDRPSVFESARVPGGPSSPNMTRNVILAFVAGAVLAVAFFVIQFVMDDRARTSDQLQKKLGLPTLGLMPIQASERRSNKISMKKGETKK